MRLAGFSSGRSVCARGGRSARRCGSLAAFCVRIMPAVWLSCGVLRSITPAVWLSCGVLRSDHACRVALLRCFAFGSRLPCSSLAAFCVRITPAVCRIAPNRTACEMLRSYSAVGRDRHSRVLESSIRLSGFLGSLRDCAFSGGDPDGGRRDAGDEGGGEA